MQLSTLTTSQLIGLINLQNKAHRSGFIRSLEHAGIVASPSAWRQRGRWVRDGAQEVCVVAFNPGKRVERSLYAEDQTELTERIIKDVIHEQQS